jgi:DNA-directed RNA polymerase II subunit RPB9
MRFCKDCNNMLYATDKKDEQTLTFICKNCKEEETVDRNSEETNCVYKNEVKLSQTAIKIDPSIINDPTYSRTRNFSCPECGYTEAIFFQNPNLNDTGMKLIFVCCNKKNGIYCGKWWFNKTTI